MERSGAPEGMMNMTATTSESARAAPAIIFLHVPKSAGVSLHMVMNRQYPRSTIYGTDPHHQKASLEEFKRLPVERRQSIRVLRGHIGFGVHRYLPQPSTYITLLRDPVDRVISHYYYIRQVLASGMTFATRPWLHETLQMDLADYVRYGTSTDLRNGQVKFISGVLEGWDTDLDLDVAYDPGAILASAKRNIEAYFLLAGLTERFDETLLLLKHALGWNTPLYVRLNETKRRPAKEELPKGTLRLLERCNEADIELYRFAEGIFTERLRQRQPALTEELRVFQALNRGYNLSYGRIYRLQSALRSGLRKLTRRGRSS
jgi:hypothetical protein